MIRRKQSFIADDEKEQGIRKRIVRQICVLAMCCMASLFCLVFVELLNRGSARLFYVWTAAHKEWLFRTFALLFCWNVFCICLRGKPSAGIRLANGFVLLFSLANYYKMIFRAEPFELTDLTQAKEGLTIFGKVHPQITPEAGIALIVLLLIIPLFFPRGRLPGGVPRYLLRLAISAALLAGCLAAFVSQPIPESWRVQELYANGGFLRGLAETMPKNGFAEPVGYSKEMVAAAAAQLEGQPGNAHVSSDEMPPDIVFIMSESLYDLNKTGALALSADPLADFKALQEAYAGGEIMALGYGGGTYYSEYEVLTGYRVCDTPGQLYYDSAVTKAGMDTVLTVLRNHGYSTMAIHPNDGGFYRRSYNYSCLGFDKALFSDDGIGNLELWMNGFPRDRALFSFAEEKYANWTTDGPRFMHIVTYQNHGSYGGNPVRTDISVLNREGAQRQAAENFANGILEHTEALSDLLAFFTEQERRVIVVVWGDHAPNMKEFGVDMPNSVMGQIPYYLTPLLVWNNYGAAFTLPDGSVLPPFRLGAWLLFSLGFCDDAYLSLLGSAKAPELMTILHLLYNNGRFYIDDERYNALDGAMRMLHYDRLLGKGYLKTEEERSLADHAD